MSIDFDTTTGTFAPVPDPKKKKRWFTKPVVFLPVGALVLGLAIGGSGKPEPVTVQGPEREVTKTVTQTPASCLKALDLAEEGFDYAAQVIEHLNEGMQAASRLNVAGIDAASAKMKVVNPKLSALAPKMNAAKADCRAAQ